MRIDEAPITDVRGPLAAQRGRLLGLLRSLGQAQWLAPTAAPGWSVKDIAVHLLDADLSWLARNRDHDQAGTIAGSGDAGEFAGLLAERNQRWVDGARMLSPQLITGLLGWSGAQLDACLGTANLMSPSSVRWAGQCPLWFDLAREFTERWVHYQQIAAATGSAADGQQPDEYLPLVLATFIWGFPHQYHAAAPEGTTIALNLGGAGPHTLTRTGAGWTLDRSQPAAPAATLTMTGDAAWRLLTGASYDSSQLRLDGDLELAGPLLQVRGIVI